MNDEDLELMRYLISHGWATVGTKIDEDDQAQVICLRKNGNRDIVFTIEADE